MTRAQPVQQEELILFRTQCTIPVEEENADEEGQGHDEQVGKHGEAERKHVGHAPCADADSCNNNREDPNKRKGDVL